MTAGDTESGFSHLDAAGYPRMVDVSRKDPAARRAVAEGAVYMSDATLLAIAEGQVTKGSVLSVAELAGIMGAKRTPDLIPLCHGLNLDQVAVTLACRRDLGAVTVRAEAATTARTGVEMEALTATSLACLTVYDMAKARERGMTVGDIRLIHKSGGKSGDWHAATSITGHGPSDATGDAAEAP